MIDQEVARSSRATKIYAVGKMIIAALPLCYRGNSWRGMSFSGWVGVKVTMLAELHAIVVEVEDSHL